MKFVSFVFVLCTFSAQADIQVGDSITFRAEAERGGQVFYYDRTAEIVMIDAKRDQVRVKNTMRTDDGLIHEEFAMSTLSQLQALERAIEKNLFHCTPEAGKMVGAEGTAQFEVLQTPASSFDTCHFIGRTPDGENIDVHLGRFPIFQIGRIKMYNSDLQGVLTETLKSYRKN